MKTITKAQAKAEGFTPFSSRIVIDHERHILNGMLRDMVAAGRPYCVVQCSATHVAVWAKPKQAVAPIVSEPTTHKVCARCKVSKPLNDYTSGKCQGDVDSTCKVCRRGVNKEYRARKKALEPVITRVCIHCGEEKTRDHFTFGNYPGNLSGACKPCQSAYGRAHNAAKTAKRKAEISKVSQPCTKCAQTGKHRLGRLTAPGVFTCTHHLIAALKKGEQIAYTDGIV